MKKIKEDYRFFDASDKKILDYLKLLMSTVNIVDINVKIHEALFSWAIQLDNQQ